MQIITPTKVGRLDACVKMQLIWKVVSSILCDFFHKTNSFVKITLDKSKKEDALSQSSLYFAVIVSMTLLINLPHH